MKKIYFIAMMTCIITLLSSFISFSYYPLKFIHFNVLGILFAILLLGLWRLHNKNQRFILTLSSFFFALVLLGTMNGTAIKYWMLIPFFLLPVFTSLYFEHKNIISRLILSIILLGIIHYIYPPILSLVLVFVAYYLQMMAIFYSDASTDFPWVRPRDYTININRSLSEGE